MRIACRRESISSEPGNFDRPLWIHAKVEGIEEYLQLGLLLNVSARGSKGIDGLAVLQRDGRSDGLEGALSGGYVIWMLLIQPEVLHAVVQHDAGVASHDSASPAIENTSGTSDDISVFVHDGEECGVSSIIAARIASGGFINDLIG